MNTTIPEYLEPLRNSFEKNADMEIAISMKKYMRDKFEFFGIPSPRRKEIYKEFRKLYGLFPDDKKEKILKWCWESPQREYQMFAMEFMNKTAKKEAREIIKLYEYMIVTKSWWDTVDFIAANMIGTYFKKFPEDIPVVSHSWLNSGNIWLQRSCLLFQLKYKSELDTKLLESFIFPLADCKEFFIKKAIGWILREYSKTNPEYVIQFVNDNQLSNLSKKEALLWMSRKGIN